MKVIKIIGLVLAGLCVLGLGGAYLYFSNLQPVGEVVFMTPPDQPVELRIDGGETISLSGKAQRRIELPTGPHTVEVLSPEPLSFQVDVPRYDDVVVPVLPGQCFALFDASFMYASEQGGEKGQLRFIRLWQPDAAFEPGIGVYTSRQELPEQVGSVEKTELLVTDACENLEDLGQRVRDK